MNGENGNDENTEDVSDDLAVVDDVEPVSVAEVDNVGDISVEINVEELVAKLEAGDDDNEGNQREIKQRLEELREQREADSALDSTYNFDLDEDV